MAYIHARGRRRLQPGSGAVGVDWGNPITRGLLIALPIGREGATKATNAVNGSVWTATTLDPNVSVGGTGLTGTAGGNDKLLSPDTYVFGANVFTIVHDLLPVDVAAFRTFWTLDSTTHSTVSFVQGNGTGVISFFTGGGGVNSSTGLMVAGEYAHWAFRYDGASTNDIYKNGVLDTSGSNGGFTPSSSAVTPQLFSVDNLGTRGMGGPMTYWCLFKRFLSVTEIMSIRANPRQIFKPIDRRISINTAAASNALGSYYYRQVAGMGA